MTLAESKPRPRLWVELGHQIATLRERAHLSQAELGKRVGRSEGYFGGVESGRRRPDALILRRTADALGVDYEPLAKLAGFLPSDSELTRPRPFTDDLTRVMANLPWVVPIYEDAPVHAGSGGVPIQFAYLPSEPKRRNDAVVGLVVKGRCMEPRIEDGDWVIIDKEGSPKNGEPVVLETEDGWSLRRFFRTKQGIELRCDNPESRDAEVPPLPDTPLYPVFAVIKQDLSLRE